MCIYSEYDYSMITKRQKVRTKWVLQGKKLERKKIMVEYLAFQGGDLLPL